MVTLFLFVSLIHMATSGYRASSMRFHRREVELVVRAARKIANKLDNNTLPASLDGEKVRFLGDEIYCSYTDSYFIWKTKNENLSGIPVVSHAGEQVMFYACSSTSSRHGRRWFVFSDPVGPILLNDSEIDWELQTRRNN